MIAQIMKICLEETEFNIRNRLRLG